MPQITSALRSTTLPIPQNARHCPTVAPGVQPTYGPVYAIIHYLRETPTYGAAGRHEGHMPTARINGFDMYYEVAGQGVPLLFVHGGLGGGRGSALFRQHHMPVLAPYAHVIAFDRRAAGLSATPSAGYSFDEFVADIVALLDHLGQERAELMGHSAGGPQVLQCALTHPARVMA